MDRFPTQLATTYAELLEELMAHEAGRSIGDAPGTFVTKEIKGHDYHYFQYSLPGGGAKQVYLGPKSPELDAVVARFAAEKRASRDERVHRASLVAMLRAGGAAAPDAVQGRVIASLADAGIFKLGGVLVGTHAFLAIGNMLGVRWSASTARTDDIDIAAAPLEIALPDLTADIPAVLEGLQMGFLPVPAFSHKEPSTTYRVRGKALRVDLLTPARGKRRDKPLFINRFNAAAAPLDLLDYLVEDVQPAALLHESGALVQIPHPARYALHKLLIAPRRPTSSQLKAGKDVDQAAAILAVLAEDRPWDIETAVAATKKRGHVKKLAPGLALLEKRHPATHAHVARLL